MGYREGYREIVNPFEGVTEGLKSTQQTLGDLWQMGRQEQADAQQKRLADLQYGEAQAAAEKRKRNEAMLAEIGQAAQSAPDIKSRLRAVAGVAAKYGEADAAFQFEAKAKTLEQEEAQLAARSRWAQDRATGGDLSPTPENVAKAQEATDFVRAFPDKALEYMMPKPKDSVTVGKDQRLVDPATGKVLLDSGPGQDKPTAQRVRLPDGTWGWLTEQGNRIPGAPDPNAALDRITGYVDENGFYLSAGGQPTKIKAGAKPGNGGADEKARAFEQKLREDIDKNLAIIADPSSDEDDRTRAAAHLKVDQPALTDFLQKRAKAGMVVAQNVDASGNINQTAVPVMPTPAPGPSVPAPSAPPPSASTPTPQVLGTKPSPTPNEIELQVRASRGDKEAQKILDAMDARKKKVAEAGRQGPEARADRKDAAGLRKEFNSLPEVKDYKTSFVKAQQVVSAMGMPNLPKDITLSYNFNKLLDPTSVVREGEFERLFVSQSFMNRLRGAVQKLMSGGSGLTPEDRKTVADAVRALANDQRILYDRAVSDFTQYAKDYGYDPRTIVGSPIAAPGKKPAPPAKPGSFRHLWGG